MRSRLPKTPCSRKCLMFSLFWMRSRLPKTPCSRKCLAFSLFWLLGFRGLLGPSPPSSHLPPRILNTDFQINVRFRARTHHISEIGVCYNWPSRPPRPSSRPHPRVLNTDVPNNVRFRGQSSSHFGDRCLLSLALRPPPRPPPASPYLEHQFPK